MERKIEKMTPMTSIKIPQMKSVAAYVRVSSEKESMIHSMSAQVSYFSDYIQRHSGWLYAGVYADEAKTGTKDARPEFQRLLEDCRAGKIQIVLTKSISRFARNTVTLLATVRELTDLGIAVYFERENIWSNTGDGELMLSLLAAYAEEESLSVSENCK
jgi:DNA invertase Pin-like site-specific DNA recombinase